MAHDRRNGHEPLNQTIYSRLQCNHRGVGYDRLRSKWPNHVCAAQLAQGRRPARSDLHHALRPDHARPPVFLDKKAAYAQGLASLL